MLAEAMICLSLNIYHESRGEDLAGKAAVAQVVMKRAGYDQEKVCGVVFANKQFSWANKLNATTGDKRSQIAKALVPKQSPQWAESVKIAKLTLEGKLPRVIDAIGFHATSIPKPKKWPAHWVRVAQIGGHVFYNDPNFIP